MGYNVLEIRKTTDTSPLMIPTDPVSYLIIGQTTLALRTLKTFLNQVSISILRSFRAKTDRRCDGFTAGHGVVIWLVFVVQPDQAIPLLSPIHVTTTFWLLLCFTVLLIPPLHIMRFLFNGHF